MSIVTDRPPAWFRVAALLAMLWTLFGILTYLDHVGMVDIMAANEEQRQFQSGIPSLVTAAYAIAVFVGAVGALGLVARKRWARPLLIVSAIAVLVQELWTLLLSDAAAVYGTQAVVMPVVIITASLLMVLLAHVAASRGWLR